MDTRFSRFAPLLRDMTEAKLEAEINRPRRLLLGTDMTRGGKRIDVAYFPAEPLNLDARIVIVGLTPGQTQMRKALNEARRCLRDGLSQRDTLAAVKVFASFSGGPMRRNLVDMLDSIGVNGLLGLRSVGSLWDNDTQLTQFTSVLRFPVFVDGHNYSGTPSMFSTPLLREQLTRFVAQAAKLRRAIFVPLGEKAGDAVEFAAREIGLDDKRVLAGLPHPSGANAERIAFFLGRKPREALSSKVDPEKVIAARRELKAKVAALASRKS